MVLTNSGNPVDEARTLRKQLAALIESGYYVSRWQLSSTCNKKRARLLEARSPIERRLRELGERPVATKEAACNRCGSTSYLRSGVRILIETRTGEVGEYNGPLCAVCLEHICRVLHDLGLEFHK